MVHYSTHVLNSKPNCKIFWNKMAFGFRSFYLGCISNGPYHSISNHLSTKQVKVCNSDKFTIQMFTIQILTVLGFLLYLILAAHLIHQKFCFFFRCVQDLRKKVTEQERIIKMNEKNAAKVKQLADEIR